MRDFVLIVESWSLDCNSPSGDFNNNCIVDLLDFGQMAESWLADCINNPTYIACGGNWPMPTGPTVTIAAPDSNDDDKAIADIICPGTNDDSVINTAIVSLNNSGGGIVHCLPGTYKVKRHIWFKNNTANIVLSGSGPSTIFEKETIDGVMNGAPVAEVNFSTVTATTDVFTPSMVGQIIQFATSNMTYEIEGYVSPTQIYIGSGPTPNRFAGGTDDASSEIPSDAFRIGDTYHVVHQQYCEHHLWFHDFRLTAISSDITDTPAIRACLLMAIIRVTNSATTYTLSA